MQGEFLVNLVILICGFFIGYLTYDLKLEINKHRALKEDVKVYDEEDE